MPTVHIEAEKEDIAKRVLMPGDPNRVKYIAEKYLTDAKLVNKLRGELAYTGYYKDVKVTMLDINERALNLAKKVLKLNKLEDITSKLETLLSILRNSSL